MIQHPAFLVEPWAVRETELDRQQRLHEPDGPAQSVAAFDAVERLPQVAARLGVDDEEATTWRDAAQAILVPSDEAAGVHSQAESFTQHRVWDFAATSPEQADTAGSEATCAAAAAGTRAGPTARATLNPPRPDC